VLYNRAKALLLIGAIFKSTQPDESDEERRELERYVHSVTFSYFIPLTPLEYRMVAEAAKPKQKKSKLKTKAPGMPIPEVDATPADKAPAGAQADTEKKAD